MRSGREGAYMPTKHITTDSTRDTAASTSCICELLHCGQRRLGDARFSSGGGGRLGVGQCSSSEATPQVQGFHVWRVHGGGGGGPEAAQQVLMTRVRPLHTRQAQSTAWRQQAMIVWID